MLTDIHSHTIHSVDINTVYNIRINDTPLSLPHGPNIHFSAGIHPWDAADFKPHWLDNMSILMTFKQVIAVGECGLDKNCDIPFEIQQDIFQKQVLMAHAMKKPLIIHCVGYFNELQEILKKSDFNLPVIIHGFRGKPELAAQLVKAGFYLSFGIKNNPESVKITPANRIFAETDENEIEIASVYELLAGIKSCSIDELNASSILFGL
jgi:TatD DNase family protein